MLGLLVSLGFRYWISGLGQFDCGNPSWLICGILIGDSFSFCFESDSVLLLLVGVYCDSSSSGYSISFGLFLLSERVLSLGVVCSEEILIDAAPVGGIACSS